MQEKGTRSDLHFNFEIKLRYDLHVPEGASIPRPLLIAVHGYGAHKSYMMREARLVAPGDWVIAAVQAPHQHFRQTAEGYRVGFGWLTDYKPEESVALHHEFLNHLIGSLVSDGTVDPTAICLYGFSQACALDFRYAFTFPDRLRAIIGVCGGIPGDIDSNPIYKPFPADTLYLYGDNDEFYSQQKFIDFDKTLRDMLPNYRSIQYHAKHEITDEMRDDARQFLGKLK